RRTSSGESPHALAKSRRRTSPTGCGKPEHLLLYRREANSCSAWSARTSSHAPGVRHQRASVFLLRGPAGLISTLHDPVVIGKILAPLALCHSGQSPGLVPLASGAAAS